MDVDDNVRDFVTLPEPDKVSDEDADKDFDTDTLGVDVAEEVRDFEVL